MVDIKENNNTERKTIVIIIGNGFDIANNFKTSYSEFVKSEYFNNLIEAKNSLAIHINGVYNLYNWVDVELEIGKYSFNLENKTSPHELEKANRVFEEENLNRAKALDFVGQSFRNGEIRESGTAIVDILPPMGLFGNAGAKRAEKKKTVLNRLKDFFDRFYDISGGMFLNPDHTTVYEK